MNKEAMQLKVSSLKKNLSQLEKKMADIKRQSFVNEYGLTEPELTKLKRFFKTIVKELR